MKANDGVISFMLWWLIPGGKAVDWKPGVRKHGIREGRWEQTVEDLAIDLLLQSLSDIDSQVQAKPE
jgi:hypothetical protein